METPVERIQRIRSHAGHARFLATVEDTGLEIPRQGTIPSPYAYSPTHLLYRDSEGQYVFVVETSHKIYDVFAVSNGFVQEFGIRAEVA